VREEESSRYFTDLDGRFNARLAAVGLIRRSEFASETTGFTSKYSALVKVQYQKNLMGLLEEGMLLAVRNFKATPNGGRFTLLEISAIGPEHFGLRGLSDDSYYPYQFEVIEQSVEDWATDDKATMMIQLLSVPLNYDLLLNEDGRPEYVKGFTYPVVGERVHILNKAMIHAMYNREVLDELGVPWDETVMTTFSDARRDARLGVIKMFEGSPPPIPIYVSFDRLVRYHFGVFSFTGGGKSNLVSNVIRRIIYHTPQTKVVVFDISM